MGSREKKGETKPLSEGRLGPAPAHLLCSRRQPIKATFPDIFSERVASTSLACYPLVSKAGNFNWLYKKKKRVLSYDEKEV